jgi:glycosyltransferase involved in cell wall biosynthesis
MYINEKPGLLTRLKNKYIAPALKLQSRYDGYIYLTEAMAQVVAPGKPYMVMEGIADLSNVVPPEEKTGIKAVMYAGMLHEKYGIPELLEAFSNLDRADTELWLFGDGTAVPRILQAAERDSRIRYFGTVTRGEILDYERKATLLVNPRDPGEDFTQYSFPSKTIEYMLSGTPLLTTRLKGIPEGYFDYVFSANTNSPEELTRVLCHALAHTPEQLRKFGTDAQQFIVKNKGAQGQTARILEFFEEVMHDAAH